MWKTLYLHSSVAIPCVCVQVRNENKKKSQTKQRLAQDSCSWLFLAKNLALIFVTFSCQESCANLCDFFLFSFRTWTHTHGSFQCYFANVLECNITRTPSRCHTTDFIRKTMFSCSRNRLKKIHVPGVRVTYKSVTWLISHILVRIFVCRVTLFVFRSEVRPWSFVTRISLTWLPRSILLPTYVWLATLSYLQVYRVNSLLRSDTRTKSTQCNTLQCGGFCNLCLGRDFVFSKFLF